MLHRGVIVGRGSAMGNVFRLQPPLCIGKPEVHQVIGALEETA
jgi:4-aminobutyrate aminotransferase-like enzyme